MSIIEFTPKEKRVKLYMHKSNLHRTQTNKEHIFDVSVLLSDSDAMTGMPEWIQAPYASMLKQSSHQRIVKLDVLLNNMMLELRSTKGGKRLGAMIMDASLSAFRIERAGSDDAIDVTLYFTMKFPGRSEIHQWTWDRKGAEFFCNFEHAQQKFDTQNPVPNGTAEDVEEDDDEQIYEDEDDADEIPPRLALTKK